MAGPFPLRKGSWARPDSIALDDGAIFADRYRVLRTAAFGGMSRIYEAEDQTLGQRVALKVLSIPNVDQSFKQRFEREIQILRSLAHPNLVRALDSGRTPHGALYLTLEWLVGSDLTHLVQQGPVEPRLALAILRGALRGLRPVHASGVVHRDLKPANIFLVEGASPPDGVKLLDFGVAKLVEDQIIGSQQRQLTTAGMVVGTPFYMAPEQAQGATEIDTRADLFSLGAVLFECVSGKRPFTAASALALLVRIASEDAPSVRQIKPDVPQPIEAFLKRALERDRNKRFQTIDEMDAGLDRVLRELDGDLSTTSVTSPFAQPFAETGQLTLDAGEATGADVEIDIDEPEDAEGGATMRMDRPEDVVDHAVTLPPDAIGLPIEETLQPTRIELQPAFEEAPVTALVADLSGTAGAREAAWAIFEQEVEREGGQALPLRGGLAIAVFGEGGATGDEPMRAVRAGLKTLAMRPRLPPAERPHGEIRVAIGSNRQGALRAARGREAGEDAIESACAMLDYAEPGEIVLDDATSERCGGSVKTATRGGSAYVVTEALAKSGPVARPRATSRTAATPFVGRRRELDTLLATFRTACDERRPRGATILGPPGIGKSRLRQALHRELVAATPAPFVLLGQGQIESRSVPYSIFADVLRRRGVVRGGEAPGIAQGKVERLVPAAITTSLREKTAHELLRLMGVAGPEERRDTERGPPSTGALERSMGLRAKASLLDVLRGYASERPLVLLLDDMQWSDPASLAVVAELLRSSDLPIVVVSFARPELVQVHAEAIEALDASGVALTYELGPLDAAAIREIVTSLAGAPVGEDTLRHLVARTGGNPFFLEETALAVVSERLHGSAIDRDSSLGTRLASVPDNVQAVIRSRIDALPRYDRELLQLGSIFGHNFWDLGLMALGHPDPAPGLERLVVLDFIEALETSRYAATHELRFRSTLLRDVCYGLVPESERRRLHQAAADWLEASGETDALAMARQLAPAGERTRAVRALLEGARRSMFSGDPKSASQIAGEGLALATGADLDAERLALLSVQEESLELLGQYDGALDSVERMATMEPDHAVRWRNESRAAALMLLRGDSSGALRRSREALELEETRGREVEAAYLALGLGDALEARGDTVSACTAYQRSYQAGKKHGDRKLVALGLLRLGRIAYATADLGQALRLAEDAKRRFAEELGDRRGEAEAWTTIGAIHAMAGASEQALAALDVALETFDSVADRRGVSLARGYKALAFYELGRTADCDRELAAVSKTSRLLQGRQPLLLGGLVSLRGMLDLRRDAEARDFARQLFDTAVRTMPRFVVPIESALGLAIARTGDLDRGRRHTEAAVARLESQKATEDEDPQRIYANYATVLELAGARDEARPVWAQAATTAAEIEARLPEAMRPAFRARAINRLISGRQ